eukprot:SAG25_NODE_14428_length_255_cov_0.660256_1_plen_48_part_10
MTVTICHLPNNKMIGDDRWPGVEEVDDLKELEAEEVDDLIGLLKPVQG